MSDEYEPEDPSHLIARAKLEAGLNEGAEGEYPTDLVEELVGVLEKTARENDALWDNLNERDGELSDMTARAEAAEAVIAAALVEIENQYPRNRKSDWTDLAIVRASALDFVRAALAAAPQTVLAERIAQAKAEALKDMADELDGEKHTGWVGAIGRILDRADVIRSAVSHPEPTEEER